MVLAIDYAAALTILVAAGILAYYMLDREPPFAVIAAERPAGVPGAEITFRADVKRDVSRGCYAVRTVSAYHSDGVRTDYGTQRFSASQIAGQEARTPGRMAPTFRVPLNAQPGRPAHMLITLNYVCNQAHEWFGGIEVQNEFPFDVLPP